MPYTELISTDVQLNASSIYQAIAHDIWCCAQILVYTSYMFLTLP